MSRRYLVLPVLAVLAAAGCSSGGTSAAPSRSATPSGKATGSGTATPTPTGTAEALPGSCQGLLPVIDLDEALGVPMIGQTVYIQGVPEPKIKRTGRVTCRLGVTKLPNKKSSPPKLEVGVSTYTDDAAATQRVENTVVSLRSQGARPTDVQVGGLPAKVLTGAGAATLVVATGNRTIVISIADRVVPPANTVKALTAVGNLAMKNLPQQ
jgi:hypothetical protein